MSETLSQDPEALSSGYTLASAYPATSSSDPAGSNLPPFSTFAVEMDTGTGYNFTESSIRLDMPHQWEFYQETRLLDHRADNSASQPQYRPWESKTLDAHHPPVTTFADAFAQNGVSKLPSFQSQFQSFNDAVTTSEPTLTTLTPVSPSVSSPNLTTLGAVGPNFHTLNARNYPLVPAPIQAREIPAIQQQFLEERHIQLYTHPTTFPPQNGTIIQNISAAPTMVTVVKTEPDLKLMLHPDPSVKLQNVTLHPTQFQNPMSTIIDNTGGIYNGLDKKINGLNTTSMSSPTRSDFRKKERRKLRASSLESSAESDGASSNMEIGNENSGQVAAVSSTAGFKHHSLNAGSMDIDDMNGGGIDKQVKKKRKRCGECIGCQRKDNCGDCAPCRNDKSHQICKQRRCEKLTEKKNLYGEQSYVRGETRRGRGKGRGGGSYRGRKAAAAAAAAAAITNNTASGSEPPAAPASRPSPQPAVHMIKQEPQQQQPQQQQPQPVQQQTMAPMPFYADPNRFTTSVWQADPTAAPQEVVPTWPQGQFIQQIAPAQAQPTLEAYSTQQYPNGIYQTTYQQAPFEANTFYTGAVQVLTSTRPPSVPNPQLTPRTNGSYTPSPSPVAQSQPQPQQAPTPQPTQPQQQPPNNGQRTNMNGYEYIQGNYVPPATPPIENQQQAISRPSSVNANAPSGQNQSYQPTNNGFTSVSSTNFSPSSNTPPNYVIANSGNERPGYPQVNSNPPLASHNSSGYPGQFGGNTIQIQQTIDHQQQQQQQQQVQLQQQWVSNGNTHVMWEQLPPHSQAQIINQQQQQQHQQQQHQQQQQHAAQEQMNESAKQQQENATNQYDNENNHHDPGDQFNQAHRVNLNSRIKTMILNKQEKKMEDVQKDEHNKQTGHFLWYSHHRRLDDIESGGGGFQSLVRHNPRFQQINRDQFYNNNNNTYHHDHIDYPAHLVNDYTGSKIYSGPNDVKVENCKNNQHTGVPAENNSEPQKNDNNKGAKNNDIKAEEVNGSQVVAAFENKVGVQENKIKTNMGNEIPRCNCFPSGNLPPEPGMYYTHLGCSSDLQNLRKDFECRTGLNGKAIRIEKIKYTGKEGKSAQGCPIAKWIIRRMDYEEKYLVIVKHRQGHSCYSAFIVVCIVAWDGILQAQANNLYALLTDKLNKFGLPTTRRCGTNEQRMCACQGLHPETCGASFSFGCSWSMYYNGCKFARSKCVRKFRLAAQNEEKLIEEKLQELATYLVPLYKTLVPMAFKNQCANDVKGLECRLGYGNTDRPFSGVTACLDFCAHSHKDTHNMNDGCTVVVTLTKERVLFRKPLDEQLHVLPLYTVEDTDEFGTSQSERIKNGSIEVLKSYKCEVRVRTVPLPSCKRTKKQPKDEVEQCKAKRKSTGNEASPKQVVSRPESDALQIAQVSSTNHKLQESSIVKCHTHTKQPLPGDSHPQYHHQHHHHSIQENATLENWNNPRTAFNLTYPVIRPYTYTPTDHALQPHTSTKQYTSGRMMLPMQMATSYQPANHKVQDRISGSTNSTSNQQLGYDYKHLSMQLPIQSIPMPYYYQQSYYNHTQTNCSYPIGFDPRPYNYQMPVMPTCVPNRNDNWTTFANRPLLPPLPPGNPGLLGFQANGLPISMQSISQLKQSPVIGTVKEISENLEYFKDSTIGGVAIALSHGSVLFECAKYEFHATTALKSPNRLNPTRISLVFYQHRNLNKPKHGWDAYEEKMRLRKMGVSISTTTTATVTKPIDPGTLDASSKLLQLMPGVASFHAYVPMQPVPDYYQQSATYGI